MCYIPRGEVERILKIGDILILKNKKEIDPLFNSKEIILNHAQTTPISGAVSVQFLYRILSFDQCFNIL